MSVTKPEYTSDEWLMLLSDQARIHKDDERLMPVSDQARIHKKGNEWLVLVSDQARIHKKGDEWQGLNYFFLPLVSSCFFAKLMKTCSSEAWLRLYSSIENFTLAAAQEYRVAEKELSTLQFGIHSAHTVKVYIQHTLSR